MKRVNVYVKTSQFDFIKALNRISFAEHNRRALDDYVEKHKEARVSGSLSKKVGDLNE